MNKMSTLALALSIILLGGCSGAKSTISSHNQNPLTASRYGDELADALANLVINEDPITKDETMMKVINQQIGEAKKIAADAREMLSEAMQGALIPIQSDAHGFAAYLHDQLFLSSDFSVEPGINLHVYLTQAVDPRDVVFPDTTAIDLGEIQGVYGAQTYQVPHQARPELYRTVVLWDIVLKRLHAFTQLSSR